MTPPGPFLTPGDTDRSVSLLMRARGYGYYSWYYGPDTGPKESRARV